MRHPKTPPPCESTGPIGCRSCDLHEICKSAGVLAFDTGRSRQSTGTLRTVRSGEHLFRTGDPARSLYAVRQGLLKIVRVTKAGDEQILALVAPGEVLGLEAFATGRFANDAVALEPVVCCELPLSAIASGQAALGDPAGPIVRLLSRATVPHIDPARGAVRRRVTNFLLEFGKRLADRGLDGREFALGLSRGEIASLLDTRLETVSRMLQQLHRERAIEIRGGRVRLATLTPEAAAAAAADATEV